MSMKIKSYCFVLAPCFGINAGCIPGFSEPIDADPVIENNGGGNSSESGSGSGLSSNVGGSAIPDIDRGTGVGAPAGGNPTGMPFDSRMFGAHTTDFGETGSPLADIPGGKEDGDDKELVRSDADGVMEPVKSDVEESKGSSLVDPRISGDGKEPVGPYDDEGLGRCPLDGFRKMSDDDEPVRSDGEEPEDSSLVDPRMSGDGKETSYTGDGMTPGL